jgi:hypothetical protein
MIVSAIAAAFFFLGGHAQPQQDVRSGIWRVHVVHDSFTGEVSCRISTRNAVVLGSDLVLHLGMGVDTTAALYRVDGGVVQDAFPTRAPWQDPAADFGNPSAGLVPAPLKTVVGAKFIWVRASDRLPARRFDVAGLGEALASAAAQSCPLIP